MVNCSGNGNCTDTGTEYECTCEDGFYGDDCERKQCFSTCVFFCIIAMPLLIVLHIGFLTNRLADDWKIDMLAVVPDMMCVCVCVCVCVCFLPYLAV